jgi:Holliday junction DNA helicase RuvA
MIGRLVGVVVSHSGPVVLIDVAGVGYEVHSSHSLRERIIVGEPLEVTIFTDVREDAITLYGFLDQLERQVFLLLKKVSGVGSKTASEIISNIDKRELLRIIGAGDAARLQKVRGVGRKLSERIIVELKEQVAEFVLEHRSSQIEVVVQKNAPYQEALEALRSLGFSAGDAERALRQIPTEFGRGDTGELVKEALKYV